MSRKRTAFIYCALVTVVVLVTTVLVARSGVTKRLIQNRLDKVFAPDRMAFEDASFDLSRGVLSVENLRLGTPSSDLGEMRSSADHIELEIELNPLRSPGSLRHVRLERAQFHLDVFDGKLPDFATLIRTGDGSTPTRQDFDVATAPSVECVDSTMTLRFHPEAPPLRFESLRLLLQPVTEDPGAFGLEGTGRGPGGALTEIRGGIVFRDGRLQMLQMRVSLTDLPLTPESLRASSPPAFAEELPERLEIDAERLQLFAGFRSNENGGSWELNGFLSLRDGSLEIDSFDRPLESFRGRVGFDVWPEQRVDFDLEASLGDSPLSLRGFYRGRDDLDVEARITDLPVDDSLARALEADPSLAGIWRSFNPKGGTASAQVRVVRGTPDEGIRARLDLNAVSARYDGVPDSTSNRPTTPFPLPANEVTGPILFEDGVLTIDHLRLVADEGTVFMDGRVRDGEVDLRFTGEDIAFSPRVLDALNAVGESVGEKVGGYYEELSPEGTSDLEVVIDNDADSDWFGVFLEPQDIRLRWDSFPVQLEGIRGRVEITTDGLEIDATAQRGPTTLRLQAETDSERRGGKADIYLRANGLVGDREVVDALGVALPELRENLATYGFGGTMDLELSAWAESEDSDAEFDLRLDLLDGSITIPNIGLEVERLRGPLFARGQENIDRVDIGGLRGELRSTQDSVTPLAEVWLQGALGPSKSGPGDDLVAILRDLTLDDDISDLLDRADLLDRSTWDLLHPSGVVDMVWRRDTMLSESDPDQLRLQLRGAGIETEFLPGPVTDLVGNVTVRGGAVAIEDLSGQMSGTRVECDEGRVNHESETGSTVITLSVRTEGFPLDESLASILEGPLRETYLSRGVRGNIDLEPLRLSIRVDDDSARPVRTTASGVVQLHDVAVDFGTPIRNFSTEITLEDAASDTESGLLRGRIQNTHLNLFGRRVTGGRARFELDPDRLSLFEFEASVLEGRVFSRQPQSRSPALAIGLSDSAGSLTSDLAFEGLRLREMMGSGRGLSSPSGPTGALRGSLQVTYFDPADPVATNASGTIGISDGDLGEVPVLNAFYENFKRNRRPHFNRAEIQFQIQDRELRMPTIELEALEFLTLRGQGSIGLDGYVDVRLRHSFLSEGTEALIVPSLFDSLTEIQVFGQLRSIQSKLLLLGQGEVERPPLGPIPPR